MKLVTFSARVASDSPACGDAWVTSRYDNVLMGAHDIDIERSLRMIDWELSAEDLPASKRATTGRLRSAAAGRESAAKPANSDLRAIPFEPFAATPLPEIWESDTEFAWLEFDAATVSMDLATRTGQAEYAELIAAQPLKLRR
ncbi:MAG: hypothetical protein ABI702_15020 [Burkholderiales bacterium]